MTPRPDGLPLVAAPDGTLATPAMARAMAMVDRAARHAPHAMVKRCARDALQLGAHDARCRVRYGERVRALAARGLALEQASATLVEYRDDFRASARYARTMWAKPGPVLTIQILSEMAIIARWLRRYEPMRVPEIIDAMGGTHHALPVPVVEAAE